MEIRVSVPAKYIEVLKLFAGEKDPRAYLNGINLEIGAAKSRLVATNGAMLGCFRVESEQPDVNTPLTDIIIPNNLLKAIKPTGLVEIAVGELKTKKNDKGEKVPVSNARPVTLTYAGWSITGMTTEGVFPDFRRIIPATVSGQPAQFDVNLIASIAKARLILHGRKSGRYATIGFNGDDAALLDLADENFVGVIMPLSPDRVVAPKEAPYWSYDRLLRPAIDSAGDLV